MLDKAAAPIPLHKQGRDVMFVREQQTSFETQHVQSRRERIGVHAFVGKHRDGGQIVGDRSACPRIDGVRAANAIAVEVTAIVARRCNGLFMQCDE